MMDLQKLHDELIAVENEMICADMIDQQSRWMSEMTRLRARKRELEAQIAAAEAEIAAEGRAA